MTFKEILNRWESSSALASDMGVTPDCARKWRARGNILPQYWEQLQRAYKARFKEPLPLTALVSAAEANAEGAEARP